jgi:tRNA (guanine26-N2/guanine27-N2)-dimethyltransferase
MRRRLSFGFPTETVIEGTTRVLIPKLRAFVKNSSDYAPSKAPVFYNPAMQLNRDLAVVVLQTYQRMSGRELVCCEPLAGCGIRGVRFANEVDGIRKVMINDISPEASELAEYNAKRNSVLDRVEVTSQDANLLLSRYAAPRKRFDYIDIDPFGSPVPYLDSALRAIRDGGLLALTATDMAPLCGVHPRACVRKYGGKPLRTEYCHELAARLVFGCLAVQAAKHDIGIRSVFGYSDYNYVRVYAMVDYGAKQADVSIQKLGYVLHCFSCFHRELAKEATVSLEKNCPECGSRLHAAGPLWLGDLWNVDFCMKMRGELRNSNLQGKARIFQMISLIVAEAKTPFTYYVVDKICDKFNLPVPSVSKVIMELRKAGFQAVSTHFSSKGIRTEAPAGVVRQAVQSQSSLITNGK